jgi:hypothetical protein
MRSAMSISPSVKACTTPAIALIIRVMADEFAWRKQHGFPVRWLSRAALKDEYGLTAPAAILSSVAARVDPYRLGSRLLRRMQRQGTRVFDRTQVKTITATTRSVQLTTANGMSIRRATQ